MKSIKNKITLVILLIVIILSVTLGGISCIFNYKSSMSVLRQTMIETAVTASNQVSSQLKAYTNIAFETGCIARLTRQDYDTNAKKEIIEQKVKYHNFQRGNIINLDGISIFDGNDYSARDYFKAGMNGDIFISDPLISKITGKMTIIISAPIWKDGIPDTEVKGVVYFVPNEEFLNDIVNSIKIGESGHGYLLNKNGITIAHHDKSIVESQYNIFEEVKNDSSLKSLANYEQKMINGEKGFGKYRYEGKEKILAYSPVADTDGWSLAIATDVNEFLDGMRQSILLTVIIVIVFIAIGILIALLVGNNISKPIKACVERLKLLAEGDFKSSVPKTNTKDETFVLLNSLKEVTDVLNGVVDDISYHLEEMSNGNLCTVVDKNYKGDFKKLEISIKKIIYSLNDAMSQINQSADQVSTASNQVSEGAQALSKGAVEQANSIEMLANNMNLVSNQIKDTDSSSIDARSKTSKTNNEVKLCNEKMEKLIQAMSEINNSSEKIGKIVKTIEDIAFQTNILALNAAVEAARAGEAGKGFTVVSEEVRSLANKSAEAAKNTTKLVEESIQSIEHGANIAEDTAHALWTVVEIAQEVFEAMDKISRANQIQESSIREVTEQVSQISSVVQTNSATAEEDAAASQELFAQAQVLKKLVSQFKLNENYVYKDNTESVHDIDDNGMVYIK